MGPADPLIRAVHQREELTMSRPIASLVSLSLLMLALVACVPETPIESPQNKAVVMEVALWNSRQLQGEFSEPLYPMAIPSARFDTMFVAMVKGWAPFSGPNLGIAPSDGQLQFVTASGFLLQHFHDDFLTDPSDFNKLVWMETGRYTAGTDGSPRVDSARVKVHFCCGILDPSTGVALLPWKLTSDPSTISGTTAAEVGKQIWVHAVASGLVEPVTYAWELDGVSLPGVTGTFYATSFSTPGGRDFTVTMTGANSVQQVRNWSVFITCVGGALEC